MATRNIAVVSIGAVAVAVGLGVGFSMLGAPEPYVNVQESPDPAWRVQIEEMKLSEAVGLEEPSDQAEDGE
jgi:hypothetical protein